MHRYHHDLIDIAREFRKHPTPAEELLWQRLRRHALLGMKFKRQHRIGNFVVDFYCGKKRLIIELEGGVHEIPAQREMDEIRFEEMKERDYQVMRISNEDVLRNIERVLARIVEV